MANRIEDYALIGDCETAALVSTKGAIDWLCWPRFDSGALFAALLGSEANGTWHIAPKEHKARWSRSYRDNTLILETEIETADGAVTLIDFMAMGEGASHLVRIIRGTRGRVVMCTKLILRFDYGAVVPWVTRLRDRSIKAIAGPDMVILRSSVDLKAEDFSHCAEFSVEAGQTESFVLSYGGSFGDIPKPIDAVAALKRTDDAWIAWASKYKREGEYSKQALRSLITLKALTYQPTGGIVAAPTTSLPEALPGMRNWDYRYCWLRDATFTLLAFMNSGLADEAQAWRTWLHHAVAGNPAQVQIMYGLSGERRLDEWEVTWLSGYEGAKPVRIGNAAAAQLQLDIFGEVMDVLFQCGAGGLPSQPHEWNLQCKLLEHLETVWDQPDEGLWEVRSGRRHFTHSKVMAWVAFDRAIKSVEQFGFEAPVGRWRGVRDAIHAQVCARGFDSAQGCFVQSYGSSELDASSLLIALVGFLPPDDPRIASTVEAIERRLMVNGLVRRYDPQRTDDGVDEHRQTAEEGAFLACSFWYADNLVLLGRRDEAKQLFERLVSLCNDVGLLSEEYDPVARRMLGNFPQAFSHVALINTAHNLSTPQKPAEQRSGHKREAEKATA